MKTARLLRISGTGGDRFDTVLAQKSQQESLHYLRYSTKVTQNGRVSPSNLFTHSIEYDMREFGYTTEDFRLKRHSRRSSFYPRPVRDFLSYEYGAKGPDSLIMHLPTRLYQFDT